MEPMKAQSAPINWHGRLDQLGMLASSACALHCLLLPLLMAGFPLLGELFHFSAQSEAWFVASALLVSAASLALGLLRHGRIYPSLLLWSVGALLLIGFGLTGFGAGDHAHLHGLSELSAHTHANDWGHALAMATGGFALAAAHYSNWRALKSCRDHSH